MNYVVVILTEKHLYRINLNNQEKITLGSGKKDLFPIPELGFDGQLGLSFHEKKEALRVNAKKISLILKEIPEEENTVTVCENPLIKLRWTKDFGSYPESYPVSYEGQIHIGRSSKNDLVLHEAYISRDHLLITSERGNVRIEDLNSKNGSYLN